MLNEFEWQGWCAEALGEMLALVPTLQTAPSRDHIAIAVNDCLDRYARGNLTDLSRLLGIGTAALKRYLKKEKIPRSSSLLILSYKLNIMPLDFLTMKNLVPQSASSFLRRNSIQEKNHKKYQALTDNELKYAKQLLDAALDQKTYPYTKLVDIAQKLGCHVSTLKRNFPAPCRIIQLRSRGQWISEEARAMMKHELEKALTNDKRPPASAVAQSLSCDASTLRRYFPDLYHSVVARSHEAFLEAEARKHVLQKLQEIFSEGDEILSVRALAKRVGYSGDVLWRAFPDMCKQFADRRRVKLREQHLARMDKICDEIRQAMFELHRKGIYPSANKIGELMSYKCAMMTKEGYDAWESILKELEY